MRISLVLLLWALPNFALAQVNTERMRKIDEPGFGSASELSLRLQKGNVERLNLGAGLGFRYATLRSETSSSSDRPKRIEHLVFVTGTGKFGESDGERFINRAFGHLRWTYMFHEVVGLEVYFQAQYAEFQRLNRRLLGGAGIRVAAFERSAFRLYVGTSAMVENEVLDIPSGGAHEPEIVAPRWSSYLSIAGDFKDSNTGFAITTYIQPRIDAFGDYRLLNESEFHTKVVAGLEFVVALDLRYDSRPPPDVEGLDLSLSPKLRYSF